MKESELEKNFNAMVRKEGGKAYKFVSPGNAGVPDRIVVLPGGRIGFVELKRPGGKPSKLQQHKMRELENMGCFTAVVDSLAAATAVIGSLYASDHWTADESFCGADKPQALQEVDP